ncbi:LIM domain transcription factor LMO4-like [Ruditapes philippinarum]|uniref:LIM domain transcription factor LMO4-like n=1 Tax=Ruditapes philippinarum TaxID=129788 RepID=UPI00295A9387|nr:LIM domain transcription factor LMO4-like [Ruditapes philippinarum]
MDPARAGLEAMTSGSREVVHHTTGGNMHSGSQSANQNGHMAPHSVKSCAGCGGRINDRFLLHAVDRYWHTGCLKCSCCQAPLADFNSCFTKAGMILCRNDYLRLFGNGAACGSCGQTIGASELVMKSTNSVYHVKCFACVTCHNQLVPGDRYSIVNGSLLCEQDYPKMLKEQGHSQLQGRGNQKMQFSTAMV